jgi:hypothetical protein
MSPDIIWYEVKTPRSSRSRGGSPCRSIVAWNRTCSFFEFRCDEFVEEFMYGNLRKQQLVKHWEGDTMTIDITRKVPPG